MTVGGRGRPRPRYLPPRVIELERDTPPEHIFRELVAAYLSAAPRVVIHQSGGVGVTTQAVVESFRERIGDGITVEQGPGELSLQHMDRPSPPTLGSLTFRLGERALELLRDAGREAFPPVTEEAWQRRDDVVDALAWEVHRRVMQVGYLSSWAPRDDRIDPIGWLEASRALERIGDHAVLLGVQWAQWRSNEHGEIESRLLVDIHHQAYEYVSSALVILGDPRPAAANAALDLGSALRETVGTLLDRLLPARSSLQSPPASVVVSLGGILHSLDRVIAYGQDLLEIALDHARAPRTPAPLANPRLTSRAMTSTGGNETR